MLRPRHPWTCAESGCCQKEFASFVESVATEGEVGQLGLALTFVQCFFPTPVRVAMDRMARGEDLETSAPAR